MADGTRKPSSSGRLGCLVLVLVACARCVSDPSSLAPAPPIEPPSSAAPPATPSSSDAFVAPLRAPPPDPPPDASAPPVHNPPGSADLDPDNDEVVGPPDSIPDCAARLEAASVEFRPAELPVEPATRTHPICGAPQVVVYLRGPSFPIRPAPIVTCGMALALAHFDAVVQQEAQRVFAQRVKWVEQAGTYSCRKMARFALVSEHSYANAMDIRVFHLERGRSILVLRDFGDLAQPPKTPAGDFLRTLAHRLYDEHVFSVVLTAYWDVLHKDHLHVDLARYRVDGTRPLSAR